MENKREDSFLDSLLFVGLIYLVLRVLSRIILAIYDWYKGDQY